MNKFSMKAAAALAVLGGMMASAFTASAALNLPTMNCSYSFSTNMKLGSRGTEVMNLQKVLNMYPQTQVAFGTNAGAPGYETDYFGPVTLRAVNKFHALHLVELGISAPTGNVFAGTRALLNQVCSGSTGTATLPAGCTTTAGYSTTTGVKCDSLQGNGGSTTLPAGCTSTSGYSPTTGQPCSGGTSNQTGPIAVMLSGSQPTGQLVQSQSGARLAEFTFTGNGTVTNLQLQRVGISTDSTLTNVYLYDGNTRITDAASVVTGGNINFNAPNGLFTVSGSRTITVRADIAASTSGQTVGVQLNSVTALGGSASTYSNVMGNQLQIGSVTTASVNFSQINSSAVSVDAGTTNYNVWSGSASVGTRDVMLKAATFKFVGSAPVDALANMNLFVDGVKVAGPATINAANNNKITFDLGSNPYLVRTGTHTIDVRADIVKGSNRTISISVENVADLMFEDSGLSGVNVSPTVVNATLTQSNSTYRTITVNKGSVTVTTDPAYTSNKVTGGATNVPVGQFTLKAYGEDVKVNTLQVTFATTSPITTLNNVSIYVNGGQVSTSQNFTGSSVLTYNLGSSLIIPAGSSVVLTVKADIVNTSNAAYTSGTIATKLGGQSNNAQGQSSYELVDVASSQVTSNVLTVSSGSGTFARTAGFVATTVAPNSTNVKIGSFTLQANSSEALRVNSIGVNPTVTTYAQTNVSNLRLQMGSTVLGTPVGNPATGTTTFSFNEITVPANGTVTFDVYADIGSATSGSVNTSMQVTYRGDVSNTTTTDSAAGVAVTSSVSTLSSPTLSSGSPVSQFVVGGSQFGIATFKLSTGTAGTNATVRELQFSTTGTDAIESITVGGITSPVISGGTTTVSGLNISIGSNGTDIPVTVKYAQFQNNALGQSGSRITGVASTSITLGRVEATSGSGSVIVSVVPATSNEMSLVGSKPTVTVSNGNTNTLVLGTENKVGEFTVTADANGRIQVASTSLSLSSVGVTGVEFSAGRVADGNTTISNTTVTGSSTMVISFVSPYDIAAGSSKTFSVYAMVAGTQQSGVTPYVASRLTSAATFKWVDVIGGNTTYAGNLIYNFPTNSYTTAR